MLLHDPTPTLDDRGCRWWNQNIGDEAQWLAGALLLTEDAALWGSPAAAPPLRRPSSISV
jgi:hypothetical protein